MSARGGYVNTFSPTIDIERQRSNLEFLSYMQNYAFVNARRPSAIESEDNQRQLFKQSASSGAAISVRKIAQKSFSTPIKVSTNKRRPHATLLPSPHIVSPTKTISRISQWQRGDISDPALPKAKQVQKGLERPTHHSFQARTLNAAMQTKGSWIDKRNRYRNYDSDSDLDSDSDPGSRMQVDPTSSENKVAQHPIKLSARKLSMRKRTQSHDDDDPSRPTSSPRKLVIISSEEEEEEEEEERERTGFLDDSDSESSGVLYIGHNVDGETVPVAPAPMIRAILPFVPILRPRSLPFLRRNLQVAFKHSFFEPQARAKRDNSTAYRQPPLLDAHDAVVQTLFRTTFDTNRVAVTLHSWICPLCKLLGELDSRQMLNVHLEYHHSGVSVSWLKENDNEWRLILAFPEPISDSPYSLASYFPFAIKKVTTGRDIADISITSLTLEDEHEADSSMPARASSVIPAPDNLQPSNLPLTDINVTPKLKTLKFLSPASQPSTRGRSTTLVEVSPIRAQDPRYPSPPPADNPLGPAAKYPYLPAASDDGKIVIEYSCRPGGPYLYDLLGLLPLDEFGILKWAVLDREAEIFESDDISDEHKVMHALWGRWIFLNRKRFVQDHITGAMEFVDKYWLMIHRAAGWTALRNWLLLLMVNQYLKASEVAEVLKHYEKKTSMKSWHNP